MKKLNCFSTLLERQREIVCVQALPQKTCDRQGKIFENMNNWKTSWSSLWI